MLSNWFRLLNDADGLIETRYAIDDESGRLFRRIVDRVDQTEIIESAPIIGGQFQPWNGSLPTVGEWGPTLDQRGGAFPSGPRSWRAAPGSRRD